MTNDQVKVSEARRLLINLIQPRVKVISDTKDEARVYSDAKGYVTLMSDRDVFYSLSFRGYEWNGERWVIYT